MIPEGWQKKKIKDLFEVQLGKMLSEKARTGNLYPYLANFNVRWGNFDLSKLNKMAFSEKEKKKFTLKNGDLLICEGGEIGRCAVWYDEEKEIYYQKALHRVRPLSDESSTGYLYSYMQYIATRGRLARIVGETSIAHLTREKLLGLSMPIPPIEEQKAIADLLSTWDSAIEKIEGLIKAKGKRYDWLLSKLIFSSRHVRGHIQDFTSEVSQRNRDDALDFVLSVTNYNGFVLPEEQFARRVASSNLTNYKIVAKGQYAYNPSRINVGSIARLDDWGKGVLSPMYVVFEINEKKVDSDFFLHWLSSHEAKERIRKSAQGSVRETVSFTDFGAISFPLPKLEQQQEIAESLNIAHKEIELLKKLVNTYQKQKRGLMQKLLTGQWRVKDEN